MTGGLFTWSNNNKTNFGEVGQGVGFKILGEFVPFGYDT
jgi:hypothetical protein